MKDFRIGDKVVLKNYYNGAKGEVVGIDLNERCKDRYLVKSDSITIIEEGWNYEEAKRNFDEGGYDIRFYEGYAIWTDDIEKVKEVEEETSHFIKVDAEKEFEDYILDEYKKLREQKRQTIKEMSEKVLGLTLEIKEIEAEIEKIKKDWHL